MSMESKAPIKVTELTVDQIIPSKLEENERSNGQLMGYLRDPHDDQVMIQTCSIAITDRGIPGHHKQFYDTFDKRNYILLPLDVTYHPNVQKMLDIMVALDEKFNSPETRETLFGTKDNEEWDYQDIVRESPPKDGRARPPYMKIKLDVPYDTQTIRTKLFDTNKNTIRAAGSSSLEEEQLYTIDEFCSYVKFKSTVKMIITPCKVWTMSQQMGKKKVRNYGVTWKVKQIKVSLPQYTKSNMSKSIFVDDDDDDDVVETMSSTTMNDPVFPSMSALDATLGGQIITPNTIDDSTIMSSSASEDIGNSSSSSDDDDDDEIEVTKTIRKTTKTKASKPKTKSTTNGL